MRMILKCSAILLAVVMSYQVSAAEEEEAPVDIPDSEIHLFNLLSGEQGYRIENGKNISSSPGYDNQPFFTSGNQTILFTSDRSGGQNDVFEYLISSGKTEQVTKTQSSEYSPMASPDNQTITFVRDGEGANPDQTVWQMDRESGSLSWAINSREPVGYYHFNHENGDVLFWSRYGFSVQYLNIRQDLNRFVSGNAVPGTPKQVPGTDLFSFVHRQTNGEVWIKSFNPDTYAITPVAPVYGDHSDYAWAPNGDIFRVQENVLYVWNTGEKPQQWKSVQDMSKMFSGTVYRLAISPDGTMISLVEAR